MSAPGQTLEPAAAEAALSDAVVAVSADRDVVVASGGDAETFLQGQLSADVGAMEDGESRWTLVLQPRGHVDVYARITRTGENRYVLDTDPGWGDRLVARLSRFLLRMDCELRPESWRCVALRGPDAATVIAGAEIDTDVIWPGATGRDLLGPTVDVGDVAWGGPESLELARILAGAPAMGSEMDESTIPAATGIVADAVSFTKGCFVGQELVARIDSRGGQTPERLCGVTGAATLAAGDLLRIGDAETGRVTSVAWSPRRGTWVGLAYLKRGVETPAAVAIGDGGEVTATVVDLPIDA